ncbi:delta-class carbonic anhydrase [Aestuariibacter sp. AA17]|uniref:Delta-class carbonic anhydrase n=1 Tax=Fluctibacter corallii TaxID=2984329 RepID=A0ABT3A9G3_9ALTE|nr:delta-class carbonic anhydrase [Aestuariibacter sp. AA17]MCV2884956.1 delta-class carbonic anhydrase [Aestuariibacter sp. AA17]
MNRNLQIGIALSVLSLTPISASFAGDHKHDNAVDDSVISQQRAALSTNTQGAGFGPQSPRNIDDKKGDNRTHFSLSPASSQMNLCNIHFHKNAEHAGGEFASYAGNGDGKGHNTGYVYSGQLSDSESTPFKEAVCAGKHGGVKVGDTVEFHYVHSSADITPGPTLGACLSDANKNPQLRVEAQVFVVVNDKSALDANKVNKVAKQNGLHQALNIPSNTGKPVQYLGSTTGPSYNEQGSPLQVTWRVRPNVEKLDISSLKSWCEDNTFNEDHAHGVRNLVTNPALLSPISD